MSDLITQARALIPVLRNLHFQASTKMPLGGDDLDDGLSEAATLLTALVDRVAESTAIRTNFCPACKEQADRIAELEAENARLREAHWFYLGDDYSSEVCRFGIDECISEDFEWNNAARGDHVLQITGARPVPDMWVALHYYTDAEKDARDDDESYTYTVHATEEAARAALKEIDNG